MDDGAASDFEATLVLATMTVSQLSDSDDAQQPATSAQNAGEPGAAAPTLVPENVSNHTKIWSELSEGISGIPRSQHHPSNWVGADDNDDDNEDDEELLVQTTPYYMD